MSRNGIEKWPNVAKNRPKMKNDVFFGFCEEFHTVNLILRKMVKIVKNRSKYPQKVVANGQANAHFFNWKCEYTYNAPRYGLQTLFTVICPYKIGLISKIKSNFVIFDPF